MAPVKAWRTDGGAVVFHGGGAAFDGRKQQTGGWAELELRCGQCIACKLERSRQWAVRCMHEASLHRVSSFVTLTYDDEHLGSLSLNYRDFQLFNKRARKKLGPFRFFMCGEYGEKEWRPHFHTAMFGVHFSDRRPWRKSPAGFQMYRSEILETLWPYGNCEIGDVTFESAAYIARYCTKKVTGDPAKEHYTRIDNRTGELVELTPEFAHMSRRPGIGQPWFEKYARDVFPLDRVVVRGHEARPPRFYKQLLDKTDPDMAEGIEFKRFVKAMEITSSDGPSLESMAAVAKAGLAIRGRKM